MNATGRMLTILDSRGTELTRQADCFAEDLWGYQQKDGVCPIAAEELTLDDPRDGKRDLLVRGRREDLGEYNFDRLHRYSLQERRYVYMGEVDEGR